jgi:hypothetical protein
MMATATPFGPSPEYWFLGYVERTPHLRAFQPAIGEAVTPAGQVVGADAALDNMDVRDGWLCINTSSQVWALDLPLRSNAKLIARSFRAVPALDDRHVWVCPTNLEGVALCLDAEGDIVDEGRLPEDCLLDAIVGNTWITLRMRDGHTLIADPTGEVTADLGVGSVESASASAVVMKRHNDAPLFVERDGVQDFNPDRYYWYTSLDLTTMEERKLGDDRSPRGVKLAPDGTVAAVMGEIDGRAHVTIYAVATGTLLRRHSGFEYPGSECWSRDGKWFFFQDMRNSGDPMPWCIDRESLELIALPAGRDMPTFGVDVTGIEI